MHILDYLKEKLHINSRQFEFMKIMSRTDATLLLMKQLIPKYIKRINLYSLFVVFDKIDYFILVKRLLEHNIESDVIKILYSYLRNQLHVYDGKVSKRIILILIRM